MSNAYQTAVLAETPALYLRLDVSGSASDGQVVPDLSGNGLDGSLDYDITSGPSLGFPITEPWGFPSPIETDSASRAFYSQVSFLEHARIVVGSDALIQPAGDLTLMAWLKAPDFTFFSPQDWLGKRNCFDLRTSDFGQQFGARLIDSGNNVWDVYDPEQDVALDSWQFCVAVRLGNAWAFYRNAILKATTVITSGLPTKVTSDEFQVTADQTGNFFGLIDEVVLYTHALSQPEIQVIYEAALNSLTMFGQADIRTSAIISARDEPEPVAYPFRHNWDKPVVERLRWKSSVFKPVNGATELRRQRTAPRRQIEYQHLLYNEELSRRFTARAFGGRKSIVQFEPDKVRVGDLAMGATSATFDTTYLDYEVGHYVLVYEDDDLWEHQLITAVTATGIEFDALSRAYTAPWLKPARVARIPQSQQMVGETDNIGDASTQYDLLEEDEPLSPNRIIPYSPTLTYRGRDCWDLREWQGHDYNELPQHEWTADRSVLDEQTGVVSTKTYRWGADQIQPWNMNLQGRALIAKYLGWLYERAGQSSPFWMPTFRQDLKPLTVSGNVLIVKGHEYTNLYAAADNRLDLAFVYFDNTYAMRRIQSATVDWENDVLELDTTVPTFSNLRWLSFLRRVILSSDDVELAWETDNVVRVAFAMVDAPLDWEAGSPSPSPSPSLSTSLSPSPSHSPSASGSPSGSASPSTSTSPSRSPSGSVSPSASTSPSHSASPST